MTALKDKEEKKSYKTLKIIKAAAILFLLTIALEIWMVNRLSVYGNKIQEIKRTTASLELENQILESEIAQKTSLQALSPKASALGFTSIKNLKYIKPENIASVF